MDVPPFMRSLDLDAMNASEFSEYANIGVADPEDGEFRIGIEYSSRKSVVAEIQSYTVYRGVDYVVYESESQTFYAKVQGLWTTEAYQRRRAGFTFSEFATQWVETNMQRAGNIVVHRFDRRNEVFEVCEMPSEKVLVVDLARRRCDCGHFQVERIPCRHVIVCCANQQLDWQVYVDDIYKMSEIQKVYRVEFVPLGDTETWPDYPGPTMVAIPALRRSQKVVPN
ncbi:hypothetical protein Ahy_A09g046636 [Arachis hypogaea]|uniref:SWIM-type domain-containing protein n=1 Tax=Arachis hypogaea TaxID=3818 RepID=A0A445BQC7_ARAHY|nr:hypothetical protein Ahy_A09g046636 [Arachis hypogaea]